jgi:hypothetical protein
MRRFILHPSALIVLFPLFAAAAPNDGPAGDAKSAFSLTVYSTADAATFDPQDIARIRQGDPGYRVPGYGVVREVRKVSLNPGDNVIKFADVAAGIDPTTVSFKSLTAPDTTAVVEQNYEYDLVTPDKLLEKYVGKNIIVNRKQEPLPNDRTRMPESIEAKLLSFTSEQLVLQTNNKQLPVQIIPRNSDITEIKLFDLQGGLSAKPTLVWKINAQQGGEHAALVSYQTDNITWRADYTLTLNAKETAADLSCWATLVNYSGAAYPNAKIKLVAGDVQRLRSDTRTQRAYVSDLKEKSLFEYHVYTVGHPITLANNTMKQIELFPPRHDVAFNKTYVYTGMREVGTYGEKAIVERVPHHAENTKVDVILKLANDEKSGLGMPLPAGRLRIYLRDKADVADELDPAGTPEFIGEDTIDHTAAGQTVSVRLGSAFDITGEHKQTDFARDEKSMTESFEIKLHNHKKAAVKVVVKEPMFRWSQWQITAASEKFEKKDGRTIEIPVEVGPGEEKVVTYTVKYTW